MATSTSPGDPSPFLTDRLRDRQARVPVTLLLIALNIVVFGALLFLGAGLWHSSSEVQLVWGANFGPATQDGQWWRLGTALFLHFGLIHMAMNMWALWDAGQLVERMYGSARFVLLYFMSGLGGNLLSLILRGEHAVSGGASGAIFGIYGALLICLWNQRHHLDSREFRWLFWGGGCFCLAMIVVGQLLPVIDNAAHGGGLLVGAIAGVMLLRPLQAETSVPRRTKWAAAVLLTALVSLLIMNIPAPRYRWSDELKARREIVEFLREDAAIASTWQRLLSQKRDESGSSFNQLAGEIESGVANRYEDTFEQIAQVHLDSAVPSAATLAALREYAALRRDASQAMVEGLRAKDQKKIKAAIDLAKQSSKIRMPKPGRTAAPERQKSSPSSK